MYTQISEFLRVHQFGVEITWQMIGHTLLRTNVNVLNIHQTAWCSGKMLEFKNLLQATAN